MADVKKQLKRIATDIAGVLLILLGLSLGWIPGPGGIPLILAGLALLSINNHWAKRLFAYAKTNGIQLTKILFPKNKQAQLMHDIFAIVLIIASVSMFVFFWPNIFIISFCSALIIMAISEFLINRNRAMRLKIWLTKTFRHRKA